MTDCWPICVDIQEGFTARQKWNYVKNLYQGSYKIDANGDIDDDRGITDQSFIDDFAVYDAEYTEDYNYWTTYHSDTPFEHFLNWKFGTGTMHYGNLPQWKKKEHVGHTWFPCPYSTESDDQRCTEILGLVPTKNDHGIYYMKTAARGGAWGFECTFDGCAYIVTYGNPNAYFYV